MEDGHFETLSVAVDSKVGNGDMLASGWGKGIKTWNHKLAHTSSSVEAGDEAGKHRSIEGVTETHVLT